MVQATSKFLKKCVKAHFALAFGVMFFVFSKSLANENLRPTNFSTNTFSVPKSQYQGKVFTETTEHKPSERTLIARVQAKTKTPLFYEPIILKFNINSMDLILNQLGKTELQEKAKSDQRSVLLKRFETNVLARVKAGKFEVLPRDLKWIDLKKLGNILSAKTIVPKFKKSDLSDENVRNFFENTQFGDLFNQFTFSNISGEDSKNEYVFAKEILPAHMKPLLGKYSPLRGRNCFATALSFADPGIDKTPLVNVVREAGHHKSMINNDEFSMALNVGYSLLDEREKLEGLKYGDLVAFVDAAEGSQNFTALKHAAIHIAGDVYFHKQSKSAASPIEFTTWSALIETWKPLAKQLEVQFYRRKLNAPFDYSSVQIPLEKIEWSN